MIDIIVIGAGILGLSTAFQLMEKFPDKKIMILEKEQGLAFHQSGHNSGVIHAGIYYEPGSFKARFAKAGCDAMVAFCQKHAIAFEQQGKMIVAVNKKELPALARLHQRGLDNGLAVTALTREQVREREPYIDAIAGIWTPTTGTVDYRQVAKKYAEIFESLGGQICLGCAVKSIRESKDEIVIETKKKTYRARWLVACAGLQSDRIAKLAGYRPKLKIIPFRGEYYQISPEKAHWVNGLVYPVPDPSFPFLGVHFTKMIDGSVKVGPNAVLGFAREGYGRYSFNLRDSLSTALFPGFWRLAGRYLKTGTQEMLRSQIKALFVKNVRRYLPALTAEDLFFAKVGVRAQAMDVRGNLIDDFVIIDGKRSVHVCNAPSPAATASLPIGQEIVQRLTACMQR
jgi:(S)-2-hydroxyglutarate dehydrogenase